MFHIMHYVIPPFTNSQRICLHFKAEVKVIWCETGLNCKCLVIIAYLNALWLFGLRPDCSD